MRIIPTFILMSIVLCMTTVALAQPVQATHTGSQQAYYESAIQSIADNCEKKKCLGESRSAKLRCCAETAAKKASFLRRNRQRLIEAMMAAEVPLKRYRVERFVNMSFSDHLQAKQ